MLKKANFLLAVFLLSMFLSSIAFALERIDFENPSYLFHLYYDNGQLFADRDFEFKYDIIPEAFVPEQFTIQFPFSGEVVNLKGETAATFQFDPRRGNPNFLKGKISVRAPYVPDGQRAVFYDSQGNPLVTIFVNDSSFCNDDGICNSERGEDDKTCPNDCRAVISPATSPPTSGVGGGFSPMILWSLLVVFCGAGGWYGWRWWEKRKSEKLTQVSLKDFTLPRQ